MSAQQTFSHYPAWPAPINVRLTVLPAHPCVYLPDRSAQMRGFLTRHMPPELHDQFMDAGYRRSGTLFYQPLCNGCRKCVPLRVPVDSFQPSKSQRRCWRANQDLKVELGHPEPTDEKFELYSRYILKRHHRPDEDASRESFEQFLHFAPVKAIEMTYRDSAGKLLAVGHLDQCSTGLSSVYFFFDPDESRRGLGVFGAQVEIRQTRNLGLPYYYIGYWVDECPTMNYKRTFRPHELLGTDGVWRLVSNSC